MKRNRGAMAEFNFPSNVNYIKMKVYNEVMYSSKSHTHTHIKIE